MPALLPVPAHAQNNHSWVSHTGNDSNNCTSTAPCKTFVQALSQTNNGAEVSCLDSGSFGQFIVSIAVIIDCNGMVATLNVDQGASACADGILVSAPGKVVTLRGLNIASRATSGVCFADGIIIQAATAVYIEDCVIENFSGKCISDLRTTGLTKLTIKNTIVRNNSSAGIEADPGANVVVENAKISHNATYGIFAQGTVTLANSDISFNSTSINRSTLSYGNNCLFGNGAGDAPTLIGQQ